MKKLYKQSFKEGIVHFLLVTTVLAIIFFSYIFNGQSLEFMDSLGWTYYTLSCIAHAGIILIVPLVIIYMPLAFIGVKKIYRHSPLAIIYTLILLIAITNRFVYDIYHFHINGLVLAMLTGPGATDIFVFSIGMYIKTIIIVLVVAVVITLLAIIAARNIFENTKNNIKKYGGAILILSIIVSQVIHIYGAATMKTSVLESTEAIPYYFPIRANSLMAKLGIIDISKTNLLKFNNKETAINYPLKPIKTKHIKNKLNVVIICIDSWNPRTMTKECTPNIWNFAKGAEYYTKHLSSSNGTRSSIFGMFTGLSAYYWKSFDFANVQPILISQFIKQGYKIQTYPSATFENPPFAKVIFNGVKGININTPGKTPYDRDFEITRRFIKDIDKNNLKEPFFSFLFYDLAHAIEIPKEKQYHFRPSWEQTDYMKLNNDMDPTPFFNLYRNCVAQIDSLVGLTLNKLKEKKILQNTVVLITGDHGQEFNENHKNFWGHSGNYSKWQTQIPLIYYYPGCKPQIKKYRTTHYDISTTILQLVLGVTNPTTDFSMGKSLHDNTIRDWHIVGNDLNYAFILNDGTIVEKQGNGRLKITDKNLNVVEGKTFNAKKLHQVIINMNRFFKK